MDNPTKNRVLDLLTQHESEILTDWLREQKTSIGRREDLITDAELARESADFLRLMRQALQASPARQMSGTEWDTLRSHLAELSTTRGLKGFSPSETATFVFSLKQPLFKHFQADSKGDQASALNSSFWDFSMALDRLGLYTTEVHQKAREQLINRQQAEMLELSTPVVKLWDGILALPLIGTLDSARTQVVMESLLERIVETGSEVAIIDITGVPTVDTLVAQHLLKTITAARLMGADCIVSGIRPQIAATIVHLGVDLGNITTKANLADAFALALRKTNQMVGRAAITAGGSTNAAAAKSSSSMLGRPMHGNA